MLDSLVMNRDVQLNQSMRDRRGGGKTRVGLGRVGLSTDNEAMTWCSWVDVVAVLFHPNTRSSSGDLHCYYAC